MDYPKLSVTIPNYNHGGFIPGVLDSTFSQDYPNLEVIVVDDCSTDSSIEVLQHYQAKHPNLCVLRNEKNLGMVPSIRRALDAATGEFWVSRASDDISYPGFFRRAAEMLVRHPQAAFCCGDLAFTHDEFKTVRVDQSGYSKEAAYLSPEDLCLHLGPNNPLWSHASMVRMRHMRAIPFDKPDLSWLFDYFWNNLLAFRHGVCYVPQVFAGARVHEAQVSHVNAKKKEILHRVLADILNLLINEHRDVIPYFARCRILNSFYQDVVEVVFRDESLWRPDVFILLQGAFHEWNKLKDRQDAAFGLPAVIEKELVENMADLERFGLAADGRHILVYGAGLHTRWLVRLWRQFGLPDISSIVVSGEPDTPTWCGLPVVSARTVDPTRVGLVVISSQSFEREMTRSALQLFPEASIFTFWDKGLQRLKPAHESPSSDTSPVS